MSLIYRFNPDRGFSDAVCAVLACLVLLFAAGPIAAEPLTLVFDVRVTQRLAYDGPYGDAVARPTPDQAYGGESFVLEYSIDPDSLKSSPGSLILGGGMNNIVLPSTPLDPEIDAIHPGWPQLPERAALGFRQQVDIFDLPNLSYEVRLSLSASASWADRGIFENPTESRVWRFWLQHVSDWRFFSNQQHLEAYVVTGDDLVAYLERLRDSGAQFTFIRSARHLVDLDAREESGAHETVVEYSGTATLRSVGGQQGRCCRDGNRRTRPRPGLRR